ncbi:NTP transferase domain-containing protein [Streptomyces sp. NPDC017993]|uniref:NTP transferase domain-containing protein n=1 Tax=Streptomyces sp. NPDC017993 TaxID=3365027 RepID=UPI0037A60739
MCQDGAPGDTHGVSDHTDYDTIVLAGGAARRLGGADKPALSVGGRPLLDRVLAACPDAAVTVVVGPRRATSRAVVRALEDPPGGGPLAALDAGLRQTTAPTVLVLSADLPFLTAATVRDLVTAATQPADEAAVGESATPGEEPKRGESPTPAEDPTLREDTPPAEEPTLPEDTPPDARTARHPATAPPAGTTPDARTASHPDTAPREGVTPPAGVTPHADSPSNPAAPLSSTTPPDGAMLRDRTGRDQPLVAAYRAEPLRRELERLRAAHGSLAGLPLRALTSRLTLARVPDATATASFDCDTWEDISAARARIREHGNVLDEWITAVKAELGIELDVDTPVLLDLARDAAHGVARPAAPLTTFLIGFAAGQQGRDVTELAAKAAALANRWAAESTEGGRPDGPAGTTDSEEKTAP